jgi:pyruvate dehydrogenase E1 component
MHRVRGGGGGDGARVQLLGSGTILREVLAGADLLRDDFGIEADVFSVTSFTELRRDGMEAERWSTLHPGEAPRVPFVAEQLDERPTVAATDYVRAVPDQIRPYLRGSLRVLGTDGYGRSDYRRVLRSFFEVDRHHVALSALVALGEDEKAAQAIERYDIDAEVEAPWLR